MYQPGLLESMQLKGESNIKHFVLYHIKHLDASMCGLSSIIGDLGSVLWHEVLGVFFTG
jgi:hypothetical protein